MQSIEDHNYFEDLLRFKLGIDISKKSIDCLLWLDGKEILVNDNDESIKKAFVKEHVKVDKKIELFSQQLKGYDDHIKILNSPERSIKDPDYITNTHYLEQVLSELLGFNKFIQAKLNENQINGLMSELNTEKGLDDI